MLSQARGSAGALWMGYHKIAKRNGNLISIQEEKLNEIWLSIPQEKIMPPKRASTQQHFLPLPSRRRRWEEKNILIITSENIDSKINNNNNNNNNSSSSKNQRIHLIRPSVTTTQTEKKCPSYIKAPVFTICRHQTHRDRLSSILLPIDSTMRELSYEPLCLAQERVRGNASGIRRLAEVHVIL